MYTSLLKITRCVKLDKMMIFQTFTLPKRAESEKSRLPLQEFKSKKTLIFILISSFTQRVKILFWFFHPYKINPYLSIFFLPHILNRYIVAAFL